MPAPQQSKGFVTSLLGDEGLRRFEERFQLPIADLRPLACGTRACVWQSPYTGHIIKLTTDEADAAAAHTLGRDPANHDILAKVYGVWEWPRSARSPRTSAAPAWAEWAAWVDQAYVIEVEPLEPIEDPDSWQAFLIDHLGFYIDDVRKQWAAGIAKDDYGISKVKAYGDVIEWQKKVVRAKELSAASGFNLLYDAHAGNWGFKPGRYGDFRSIRLLDFGYSLEDVEDPDISVPRLNPYGYGCW